MQLLERILQRLPKVSLKGAKSPDDEVQPGERIIGPLDDRLKRLWILLILLDKEHSDDHERMQREAEIKKPTTDPRLSQHHVRMHVELKFVASAFNASAQYLYPEIGEEDQLGVRRGWQLVAYKRQPVMAISFGGMLGLGLMGAMLQSMRPEGDDD